MSFGTPQENHLENSMNTSDSSGAFYALLDKYGNLPEPLCNWITEDLIKLMDAIDMELQDRAPPDSSEADIYANS